MKRRRRDLPRVLISGSAVRRRVAALARRLNRDYRGRELVVVSVLKGSFIFLADLVRHLRMPVRVGFVAARSYGGLSRSPGPVRLVRDVDVSLRGRHVLLVEDIVDTGRTLAYLRRRLARRRPSSLRACALLDKASARKVAVPVEYVGFRIPVAFVVGYGLDHAERWRNLPHIAVLGPRKARKNGLAAGIRPC